MKNDIVTLEMSKHLRRAEWGLQTEYYYSGLGRLTHKNKRSPKQEYYPAVSLNDLKQRLVLYQDKGKLRIRHLLNGSWQVYFSKEKYRRIEDSNLCDSLGRFWIMINFYPQIKQNI